MQAIIVNQFGGPEQLQLQEVPAPNGEVIVNAAWAGVNFVDIYQREGRYPGVRLPWAMGIEGTGIVASAPADSAWCAGDRVAYTTGVQGTYASQVAVSAAHLIPIPDAVSLRDACAAIEHGLTAIMLTEDVARLPASGSVLVHAAAGGVGGWLVQLLVARGLTVFGTASSASKAEWLQSMGAVPLRYDDGSDWVSEVRDQTRGHGVAVVFDSVGKSTFAQSLEVLAPCGHLVLFGAASGQPDPVDVLQLMKKSITLTRPVLPHYLNTPAALQAHAARVFDCLSSGTVKLRIHAEYALADVAQSHAALAERGTQGKLLLSIHSQLA
ncbi:quinone oxidoreductase family protein [Undibacterium pigrum]|uniref:NADPH:quinone reductase-like Zn-dependent oxidoreductase n=1 Tax=Undibacterium pigrum TaxID=401470 RepID=A0A318IT42_9BURK|nr:quinone oxidoreductase [Undibacterium pigrum]PXX37790.1 NADPH:quinone reductase-like Zn-dependent oxidoreductase [Undibacterium pigrum]